MSQLIEHGGALDLAMAQYGGTSSDWLDLSTGINPEAFALPQLDAAIWNRLPDEKLHREALNAARYYYGTEHKAPIVAAPGTQALIQIIPSLIPAATVAILSPTYQEHGASFRTAGWEVIECGALNSVPEAASVVVVVNPNNPDGRVIAEDDLLAMARKLEERGGFLVVDEAFADPHPQVSIVEHAAREAIIVLKSFGKFFGLAGVRLGFMFARCELVRKVQEKLGPWAVSGPALAIAQHAFQNTEALVNFRARLDQRRRGLSKVIDSSKLTEIGGTALFALCQHTNAHAIYDQLCNKHILVRKFSYAPEWLRIGLAADDEGLERLEAALSFATLRS